MSNKCTRSPSNLNSVLEMCRHKLWMYLTLSDVDICKAKEEGLKKMMKEFAELESDLNTVQSLCKSCLILNLFIHLFVLFDSGASL